MEEIKANELYRIKMVNEVLTKIDSEGKALGDYEIEMIGSTGSVDRDGEAIDPNGWDLRAFKKNPVILPQHDYRKPPVARATSVKLVDGKLMFKIEFPQEGISAEADTYRKLYKEGFMNASSVGFAPTEWVDGDGKKTPYRTFKKQQLLELSLVSVPANSEALVTAKSKGLVNDDELKAIGFEVEPIVDEVIEKSDDPNMLINDVHMEYHKEIKEFMERFEGRLTFIEGVITGMSKSAEESSVVLEKEEKNNNISYIGSLLRGDHAKSNETVSTDEASELKEVLLEKSLKSILKGE